MWLHRHAFAKHAMRRCTSGKTKKWLGGGLDDAAFGNPGAQLQDVSGLAAAISRVFRVPLNAATFHLSTSLLFLKDIMCISRMACLVSCMIKNLSFSVSLASLLVSSNERSVSGGKALILQCNSFHSVFFFFSYLLPITVKM